jgi:hypothetical protein
MHVVASAMELAQLPLEWGTDREDGRTRRPAYAGSIGFVETEAFFRQLIQQGCGMPRSVTAKHVVALRVCHDDDEFPGLFHGSLLYGVR